jgi:hypothetical protein
VDAVPGRKVQDQLTPGDRTLQSEACLKVTLYKRCVGGSVAIGETVHVRQDELMPPLPVVAG